MYNLGLGQNMANLSLDLYYNAASKALYKATLSKNAAQTGTGALKNKLQLSSLKQITQQVPWMVITNQVRVVSNFQQ